MYRRRYHKRRTFLPFVIFRTLLSLAIFAALIVGSLNAFKQFSGLDLVKIDFQKDLPTIIGNLKGINGLEIVKTGGSSNDQPSNLKSRAPLSFKFLLVADSHSDNVNLKKALTQTKDVSFVIGLGDYTDIGTDSELRAVKQVFDSANLRYFVTAGDHDLWDSRDKGRNPTANIAQVFSSPYQSFSYKNARFLIIYNSDNYSGVSRDQMKWLTTELERVKGERETNLTLALMHEPLYHPSSIRGMGKVEPKLQDQARELIKTLYENGVSEIFAGDIHYFTRYTEPESGMKMTTVGALTSVRNAQNPRFALVNVYEDGSYDVEDVEVR